MECNNDNVIISLPIATNEQISCIEYLIMNHPCTFDELFPVTPYIPHLCRLKFSVCMLFVESHIAEMQIGELRQSVFRRCAISAM